MWPKYIKQLDQLQYCFANNSRYQEYILGAPDDHMMHCVFLLIQESLSIDSIAEFSVFSQSADLH